MGGFNVDLLGRYSPGDILRIVLTQAEISPEYIHSRLNIPASSSQESGQVSFVLAPLRDVFLGLEERIRLSGELELF